MGVRDCRGGEKTCDRVHRGGNPDQRTSGGNNEGLHTRRMAKKGLRGIAGLPRHFIVRILSSSWGALLTFCDSLFSLGNKDNVVLYAGHDNPAKRVYRQVGFEVFANTTDDDGSWKELGFDTKKVKLGHW